MATVKNKEAEAPKEAPKKKPAAKAAPKAAPEKVEEMFLQYHEGEWNLAAVKEQVLAAYAAEGHRTSAIKKLSIYLKPEERRAYYVINDKSTGSVDLL